MKLVCRASVISRVASGSIQVVTKVARLRIGRPSSRISSPTRRIASWEGMPVFGSALSGAGSSRKRFPNELPSRSICSLVSSGGLSPALRSVLWCSGGTVILLGLCATGCGERVVHPIPRPSPSDPLLEAAFAVARFGRGALLAGGLGHQRQSRHQEAQP